MGHGRTYTREERLEIVRLLESGRPLRAVCGERHMDRHQVRTWWLLYKAHGEGGLDRRPCARRMPAAERAGVVRDFVENRVSLDRLAATRGVSRSAVKAWARKARAEGYMSLGGPKTLTHMGRPRKESVDLDALRARYEELHAEGRAAELMGAEEMQAIIEDLLAENALLKKSRTSGGREDGRGARREKAAAVNDLRSRHPLDTLLRHAGLARSTYYDIVGRPAAPECRAGAGVVEAVVGIFNDNLGRYGYRRVAQEARRRGYGVNRETVRRILRSRGLSSEVRARRARRYNSYKGGAGATAPNVINRDFRADAPNQKWGTDVTQINVCGAKLFLSPIIDFFNGEVVAHSVSDSPNKALIDDMYRGARAARGCLKGVILHSDQGWQYRHEHYVATLAADGVVQSMSRKGNCLDNSVTENFFGIMKTELLYGHEREFSSPQEFIMALNDYIFYYNNKRIKSRLGMSPVEYRMKFENQM